MSQTETLTVNRSGSGKNDGADAHHDAIEVNLKVVRETIAKPQPSDGGHGADECDYAGTADIQKMLAHFDTNRTSFRKFIEGDEILDKENPFKIDQQNFLQPRHSQHEKILDKCFIPRTGANEYAFDEPETDDPYDGFVTKEEVLRQSKYVKTYIKNPDKQLCYDKSVIDKINAIKAKRVEMGNKKPVPAPRLHTLPNKGAKSIDVSPACTSNARERYIADAYPELRVRVGTPMEESLWDSNEVVLNALKFDNRFKAAEFGSQDDIDSIAERTCDEQSAKGADQPDRTVDESKKSFTNTVNSADFKNYLRNKGLSLVPAKRNSEANKPITNSQRAEAEKLLPASGGTNPTKLSTITKFLQNTLFTNKAKPDTRYGKEQTQSVATCMKSPETRTSNVYVGTPGQTNDVPVRKIPPTPPVRTSVSLNKRSVSFQDRPSEKCPVQPSITPRATVSQTSIRRQPPVSDAARNYRNLHKIDQKNMKNAGVQVNLEGEAKVPTMRKQHPLPVPADINVNEMNLRTYLQLQNLKLSADTNLYGKATTAAPLYSEPATMRNGITKESNQHAHYDHIYEHTPVVQPPTHTMPVANGQPSFYGRIVPPGTVVQRAHPQYPQPLNYGHATFTPTTGVRRFEVPTSAASTPIRRASRSIDRQEILRGVYDFCRRSLRNSNASIHSAALNEPTPSMGQYATVQRRVQRVQSLGGASDASLSRYGRYDTRQTQHDRNIENVYAFVNKKLQQTPGNVTFPKRISLTPSLSMMREPVYTLPKRRLSVASAGQTPQGERHAMGRRIALTTSTPIPWEGSAVEDGENVDYSLVPANASLNSHYANRDSCDGVQYRRAVVP